MSVDLGIKELATFSYGRILENPKSLEHSLEKIRMLQRTLSRGKSLGEPAQRKWRLAGEYEHVKDSRRELFFKLGFLLTQEYVVLILGDLNART